MQKFDNTCRVGSPSWQYKQIQKVKQKVKTVENAFNTVLTELSRGSLFTFITPHFREFTDAHYTATPMMSTW